MGNKGSKGKKAVDARITSTDRAVLDLKLQRDKLVVYKRKIHTIMEREHEIARQLIKEGKKAKALLALKKKKAQAKMLVSTDQKLDKVQEWIDSVEDAQRDQQLFNAMKVGKEALEEIHTEMGGVDAVEKLLLETEEANETQRLIEERLMGKLDDVDEAAMQRELDEMEEAAGVAAPKVPVADLAGKLPYTPTELPGGGAVELPDVPTEAPAIGGAAREEEEEEEDDGVPLPPPPMAAA
uniref:Charged multivesicular body protein 6 n=1 Tax=Hemiselmis andersenii TaxID=464988 RepID=A0A6T8KSP0_HEMAN|mmetsp:Transcript_26535/g.61576  ORF Transcript_26535/g.61576 Transcript_26535/m.61576 type:complete len:239 (+) Transcript_26535:82-798(+)